jgi:hypothetical protein
MPKPTITDVAKILDPMLSDNFVFEIVKIPDEVLSASASSGTLQPAEAFRVQCRTASKPGSTIEPVPVDLFGHSLQYAGRLTFSHSLSIEYVESKDGYITTLLEAWQKMCRTVDSQHGQYKSKYAGTGRLSIFDQVGDKPTKIYTLYGIWPSEVPDMSFDGSGANLITVSCTFTYDYYKPGEEPA